MHQTQVFTVFVNTRDREEELTDLETNYKHKSHHKELVGCWYKTPSETMLMHAWLMNVDEGF